MGEGIIKRSNLLCSFRNIFSNKNFFSGVAILMVVLYHLMSVDELQTKALSIFYPGFLGVDVFFLLSGYGLCFSYNKNTLMNFYFRRMKRIVPFFLLLSMVVSCLFLYRGDVLSVGDWLCNLTSLNFWGIWGAIY